MTVASFVSIYINHHHNEQQDSKVITVLVRLQTCLVICKFLSQIYVSVVVYKVLTYLLTYLLTSWCRVLLENLTGLQLVKIFPAFYGQAGRQAGRKIGR